MSAQYEAARGCTTSSGKPHSSSRRKIVGLRLTLMSFGIMLLVAGAMKGVGLVTAPASGYSLTVMLVVVSFELVLGVWLIFGVATLWTWRIGIATVVLFATVSAWKVLMHHDSCGCFGSVRVNPSITFALDLAILAMLGLCRQGARPESDQQVIRRLRDLFPLSLGVCLFVCVSVLSSQRSFKSLDHSSIESGDLVVLEPKAWIGGQCTVLQHIEIGEDLSVGNWDVLFFRHDCHVCHDVMLELARDLESGRDVPLALVEIDVGESGGEVVSHLLRLGCPVGYLSRDKEWFVEAPLLLSLRDGVCLEAKVISAHEMTKT